MNGRAMIDKRCRSVADALDGVVDGSTIMVGGFGDAGSPTNLLDGLIERGVRRLTVISNNAGNGATGLARLIQRRQVDKIICSFPRTADSEAFQNCYATGEIKLELVPQGTLAERIRAGGAGIPAFYTPSSYGTLLAEGKEKRRFGQCSCVLEYGLSADFALVSAARADRYGNLTYLKTARNFGPIMCMAARITIAQVELIVNVGEIEPECVVTPGIFVHRVVQASVASLRPSPNPNGRSS